MGFSWELTAEEAVRSRIGGNQAEKDRAALAAAMGLGVGRDTERLIEALVGLELGRTDQVVFCRHSTERKAVSCAF